MEIFIDNSMDELVSIEAMVQQFRSSFEGVRDHTDLQWIFGLEDILNKLDDMLNDFGALRQEVWDFNKEAKNKYEALNLP